MKNISHTIFSILLIVVSFSCKQSNDDPNLKLWYDRPATIWEEALPLGNGKTGAMVFGGITTERFQLNDLTLWSGYPESGNNPDGPEILKKTRDAVFKGDYAKAGEEWKKIHGPYSARYLPMGDLFIKMHLKDSIASEYYRDLNIQKGISTVTYNSTGVKFTREAFVSYPDKAIVINLTASKKKSLSFDVSLKSKLRYTVESSSDNSLTLTGKAPYHVAHRNDEPVQVGYNEKDGEGMNFEIKLRLKNSGGTTEVIDNKIIVTNADKVTLYVVTATSYNGFDKSPGLEGKDPSVEANSLLEAVSKKQYEDVKSAHLADFRNLFDRVSLNIGIEKEAVMLPTDDRLLRFNSGKSDNQLQALYYQFSRYLLISSSRDQSIPANLQGLWNDLVQPPWGSNYTTNINTEMNYWLAENTNLSECHTPLINFIASLAANKTKTAKTNFAIDG